MGGRLPEHLSVVTCVTHDEDDHRGLGIARLQGDPTTHGLEIAQSRLAFDRKQPRAPLDHRVPGALISDEPERNLVPDPKTGRNEDAQATKQLHLRRISDRYSIGEGPKRHVQREPGPDPDKILVRNMRRETSLDTAELGNRDPDDR